MLQSPEPKYSPATAPSNSYTPVKPATSPMDQANIGRSLVIKGEVSGAESLFIDGRIEGTISFPDNRVTIGRHGNVAANINAKEVVITPGWGVSQNSPLSQLSPAATDFLCSHAKRRVIGFCSLR